MITSADNDPWPGDVPITDLKRTELPCSVSGAAHKDRLHRPVARIAPRRAARQGDRLNDGAASPRVSRLRWRVATGETRIRNQKRLLPPRRRDDPGGAGLRLEREAADREDVRLRHRGFGAVAHVGGETAEVAHRLLAAIDVARALLVRHEQMVRAGAALDVDVFAQLDVAVGAEDRETPVAPGRQAVGREPVDAACSRWRGRCAAGSRRNPRSRESPACRTCRSSRYDLGVGRSRCRTGTARSGATRCRPGCRRPAPDRRTRPAGSRG